MTHSPPTLRRWKRVEYDRLVDLGVFENDPIELIDGQLIIAEPQGAYHASAIRAVDHALRAVLPAGWMLDVQLPVSLDDASEPEPDLAVVPGRPGDYRHAHPARPVLAVEVAESSLAFDRVHKGSLYARAEIQDYWIVNLVDRVLEVHRLELSIRRDVRAAGHGHSTRLPGNPDRRRRSTPVTVTSSRSAAPR